MKRTQTNKHCVRILAADRPIPATVPPAAILDAATQTDIAQS